MWVYGKKRRREDWEGWSLLVSSARVSPVAPSCSVVVGRVSAVAPAPGTILCVLLILRLLPGRGTIKNPKVPTLTVAWMVVASAEEEGREPKRDHREERRAGEGKFRL